MYYAFYALLNANLSLFGDQTIPYMHIQQITRKARQWH